MTEECSLLICETCGDPWFVGRWERGTLWCLECAFNQLRRELDAAISNDPAFGWWDRGVPVSGEWGSGNIETMGKNGESQPD